jgi:HSP90 family molecular chaperone
MRDINSATRKEGFVDHSANREQLAKLVRFVISVSGTETRNVSLADYMGWMKGPGGDRLPDRG